MVKMDPKKARVTIPDAYLIAIGKVCVQWNMLETILELVLGKLAGMEVMTDQRSKIMVAHLTWPLKMDILGALIESLRTGHPRLNEWDQVAPLLRKAQEGRNRIVHGFWGNDEGEVKISRATARGKLKLQTDSIAVGEIEKVVEDINIAMAALYNLVLGQ